MSPGVDGGRNIGVPIGSARSRSNGTVGIGEAAGRSRGRSGRRGRPRSWDSRWGVDTPGRWSTGPAGPQSIICSRGASPVAVAVRRRVVAALDGYGKNRIENGVSGRRNRPAAGVVFGSGDGGRNTSDEFSWAGRKAVNPYTWLVCAKS